MKRVRTKIVVAETVEDPQRNEFVPTQRFFCFKFRTLAHLYIMLKANAMLHQFSLL